MVSRRKFIQTGILTSLSPFTLFGSEKKGQVHTTGTLTEPEKEVRIVSETDVIVCGGGPAGIAAAIASARAGARTTLIEYNGCLGGIWTAGLLSNILDFKNKPGIMKELIDKLGKSDAQYSAKVYDAELMKLMLDQMCLEAGVEVRLYTRVVAAFKNSVNKLEHVVTESFSGREAWKAKVFIDATGNGDLSAYAGCGFDYGHPNTEKTQPMSLMAILVGIDEEALVEKGLMEAKGKTSESSKRKFHDEILKGRVNASYSMPTMFAIRPGMIAMMANHQYGVSALDARQISKATIEARKELNQIVNGLRSLGGVWSNVRLAVTGSQIGIREGRRIHGIYKLTGNDLIRGARFDDAICRATFCVDVHSLEENSGGGYGSQGLKTQPYDIPLRSLIAKDVDGLMMAGRCISGDFFAHASYRVTGNAVVMGEAAGTVSAIASLNNILPQEVNLDRIK